MILKVKKLFGNAKIPVFAHRTDAGVDLFCVERFVLESLKKKVVSTGIAIEIPIGFAGLIWDKSGLAAKHGIKVMGGVIDSGYRGEIKVVLINFSGCIYTFEKGDKIAQMLIQRVEHFELQEVDTLSQADRGAAGFGSTGK